MRMNGALFAARQMEVNSQSRECSTRQRDKIEDGNIQLQRTTIDLNRQSGKDTNAADMEQGLCTASTTALLTAAGVCACFFPVGTIIGAILAAIAVTIMVVEAFSQKSQRDDIAELNSTASELKVETDAANNQVKRLDEDIKVSEEELRAYVQQQIENFRREYDARHKQN